MDIYKDGWTVLLYCPPNEQVTLGVNPPPNLRPCSLHNGETLNASADYALSWAPVSTNVGWFSSTTVAWTGIFAAVQCSTPVAHRGRRLNIFPSLQTNIVDAQIISRPSCQLSSFEMRVDMRSPIVHPGFFSAFLYTPLYSYS